MSAIPAHDARRGALRTGLDVQANVIGALILRELHTRYGRENIGYLWMLLEPGLLAISVASFHAGQKAHAGDIAPVAFALGGYCSFMIFRSVVGRAEMILEANQPLLYHRQVTILDMLSARAILESVSTVATLIILWTGGFMLGLAPPPFDTILLLTALLLLVWFSFAVSMLVCTATYLNKAVAKIVHPVMYIMMPLSGTFFLLSWIPQPWRGALDWFPLIQIFEMFHTGQFQSVQSIYYDPVYIVGWCLALTLLGLVSIRLVRRHIHLS